MKQGLIKQGVEFALACVFFVAASATAAIAEEPVPEDMAKIPAGEFIMGSDALGPNHGAPAHKVYLDEFWMDKYEVTNKQFETVFPDHKRSYLSPGDNSPVSRVTWTDAFNYCRAVKKYLPTESQWEKAARGGTRTADEFPWGKDFDPDMAHGGLKLKDKTAPVGSYPPNGYGLYDMGGNVWEWAFDWVSDYPNTTETLKNPWGPPFRFSIGEFKIRRGGAWSDDIKGMKTGWRDWSALDSNHYHDIGFRCASNPPKPK